MDVYVVQSAIIAAIGGEYESEFWHNLANDYLLDEYCKLYIGGDFIVPEVIESKTGSDGDWETSVYVIFKVGDKVFKKDGRYASHMGTDWDGDLYEVKPKEVQVVDWVRA